MCRLHKLSFVKEEISYFASEGGDIQERAPSWDSNVRQLHGGMLSLASAINILFFLVLVVFLFLIHSSVYYKLSLFFFFLFRSASSCRANTDLVFRLLVCNPNPKQKQPFFYFLRVIEGSLSSFPGQRCCLRWSLRHC